MTSIADGLVKIQTTPESNISTPSWFGEVVVISRHLHTHGVRSLINEQVRGCRGSVLAAMRTSIFWRCSSATPSAESAPWRSSTSGSSRLPSHSWPCLGVIACPPVRRSPDF